MINLINRLDTEAYPSIAELRLEWVRTRALLEARSASLASLELISSSSDFAATAWQHKLRAWRGELDVMLQEYPAESSRSSKPDEHGTIPVQYDSGRCLDTLGAPELPGFRC